MTISTDDLGIINYYFGYKYSPINPRIRREDIIGANTIIMEIIQRETE